MSEDVANMKLTTRYDYEKGECGSYSIVPKVRMVETSYSNKPYLEPYVLVWVSDYELVQKGE